MNDSAAVGISERVRQLAGEPRRLKPSGKGSTIISLSERPSTNSMTATSSPRVFEHIVERHDSGVIENGGGPRFGEQLSFRANQLAAH